MNWRRLLCISHGMAICIAFFMSAGAGLAASNENAGSNPSKFYHENAFPDGITVRVGVSHNPPFGLHGNGEAPKGFVIDIIRDVAKTQKWNLVYIERPWHELLALLEREEIDLLGGVAYTPKRAQKYSFSKQAAANNWAVIYRNKNISINSITDLQGKKIALIPRGTHTVALKQLAKSFGVEFTEIPAVDYAKTLALVDSGNADAGVVARTFHILHGPKYEALATNTHYNPIEIRFASPKGAGKYLLSALDNYLLAQKNDPASHYSQLLAHWFSGPAETVIPKWIIWIIGGTLILLITMWLIVIWLRDKVENRTKELSESESQFRDIIDNLPDTFYRTNAQGVIIMASPSCVVLTGYTPEELIGQPLKIFYLDPSQRTAIAQRIIDNEGRPVVVESELIRRDGSKITVSTKAFARFDDANTFIGIEGIARDITEHKWAERQLLEAKNEAQFASKVKSDFLANMSHELRTPMNAVLGFAQMLQHDPNNPLSAKQNEYVESILDGGNHLLELVNEVLDLSEIEAYQAAVTLEKVNANEVCADCVALTTALGAYRNINIIDNLDNRLAVYLRTDRRRLKQILLNLLSNAVKFNHDGGTVTLEGRETEHGFLRISVTDTGVGIATEDAPDVFELFHRVGAEPMQARDGTGIGLTVSKLLVEQLAGRIGYESQEGLGSSFWIELPLVSNEEALIWTNDQRIGISALDNDHQGFIFLANKILHQSADEKNLDNIFEELISITQLHFRREEAVMEACEYPHLNKHREVHQDLIAHVSSVAENWRDDPSLKSHHQVGVFLKEWWIDHYVEMDSDLAQYMKDKDQVIQQTLANFV